MLGLEKKTLLSLALVVAVAFAVGVVIGYYGNSGGGSSDPSVAKRTADGLGIDKERTRKALSDINTSKLRSNLKTLTKAPHIAGQKRDNELIQWIKQTWLDYGFDKVDLFEYDFYLSWPNQTNPNKIYLVDENDSIRFTSAHKEKKLREGDDHPNFVHAFNAYSPAGTIEGQLVYVNFGRVEDLKELEQLLGENFLMGKICIARYGKIYRGNIVRNCQDKGAIGAVLYTDPAQVAVAGTDPEDVYPNSIFLPGTGIQRGSTYIGDGDPLSPSWASVPHAHRVEPEEVDGLPKIPVQPIGYDDAKILLEKLGGQGPPDASWKGKMQVDYRLGGSFKAPWKEWKIRLNINNYAGTVKSSNVIGYIRGSVEPDRYVMMGNHRDAWGFGAVDPSSGTATMLEVSRVFGEMKKKGWRPRRTLIFASWGAEEYGLEGSYEWVYQHLTKLQQRTVGMVNTDNCIEGPIIKPQASPLLRDLITDALKEADDPTSGGKRPYYDFWKEWLNLENNGPEKSPKIGTLGSGTDHAAFAFYAGIPAINLKFSVDNKKHKGVGTYPTYHTGYETFYLMDHIIDPGFKIHRTCSQTSLHILMQLVDAPLLPYNVNRPSEKMRQLLASFKKGKVTETLSRNGVTLQYLEEAVSEFSDAAKEFTKMLETDNELKSNPIRLRMINDQLMQLERVFLMDGGLPERPDVRHAVFAPGKFNKYGEAGFPAIADLLHEVDKLEVGSKEHKKRWDTIKQHVSDLMIMVQSAARFLRPVPEI